MSDQRGILPLGATNPSAEAAYARIYNTSWDGGDPVIQNRTPRLAPGQGPATGNIVLDPPPRPAQPPAPTGDPVIPAGTGGNTADLMVPSLNKSDWSDENIQFRTAVSGLLQDIQAKDPQLLTQVGIEGPLGAFRTHEQQQQIWDTKKPGQRVATPGNSLHEQGLAADWHFASPEARAKFVNFASQHGLVFPFDDDTGHMQLAANNGNLRLAAQLSTDRSGMWDIMHAKESSNGTDLSQGQTTSGPSQGLDQITTETWKDFAPKWILAQWPTAQAVVESNLPEQQKRSIQDQVAANIPLGRWGPKTLEAIHQKYGDLPLDKTFGELAGMPKGQILAGSTDYGQARFEEGNRAVAALQEGLNAIVKKMNETDPNEPEMRDLLRQHRERADQLERAVLDRAFHAPERTQADVWNQFGSLAMMAAVFGGFAARVPAVASLNAAGAALEAQAANNDRDYHDKMEVWKLQTTALERAYQMERDQIQDILDDKKMSLAERHTKLQEAVTMLGLERDAENMKLGNYDAVIKAQNDRTEQTYKLAELPKLIADTERAKAETKKIEAETAALGDQSGWAPELRGNDAATRKARAFIEAEHAKMVAAHDAAVAAGVQPVSTGEGGQPPATPPPPEPPSLETMKKDPQWVERALTAGGGEDKTVPKPYTITSPDGKNEHVNLAWMKKEGKWWDADKNQPWVKPAGYSDPVPAPPSAGRVATAQSNSMVAAGNFATASLENLTELPGTSSTGWFMGTETHPPGDLSGWKRILAHKFTDAEDRAMNESAAGVQREMATLEAQGRATGIVGLTTVNQVLIPQKGDTVFDRMRKFAEIRLIIEKNMETLAHQGNLNPIQQKFVEDIQTRVALVWPYTVHDVNELQMASPESEGGFRRGRDYAPQSVADVAKRVKERYGAATSKEDDLIKNAPVVTPEEWKTMPKNSLYKTSPGGKTWRKLEEPEGGGPFTVPPGQTQRAETDQTEQTEPQ